MQLYFGVFRTGDKMDEGVKQLDDLRGRILEATLVDRSDAFNTARIEALELHNFLKWLKQQLFLPMFVKKAVVRMPERISKSEMTKIGFVIRCIMQASVLEARVNFKPLTVDTFELKRYINQAFGPWAEKVFWLAVFICLNKLNKIWSGTEGRKYYVTGKYLS